MPKFIDLTGHQYGRWTVLRRVENNKHNQPRWLCRCECGSEKSVTAGILRSGASRSCGCLNKDVHRVVCIERNTTHGQSGTRTHNIWVNMKAGRRYADAPVCDRWNDYATFIADMGECPTNRHTLDRIDNAKGYEPGNCRWATMKEQQNNRTNNRLLTFDGRTQTIVAWAEETGIGYRTIGKRIDLLGWPISEALTRPPSYAPRRRYNQTAELQ